MLWRDWVKDQGLSWDAAARLIGAANASVAYRYGHHRSVPRPPAMARIYLATGGQVTPMDFYQLPALPGQPAKPGRRAVRRVVPAAAAAWLGRLGGGGSE